MILFLSDGPSGEVEKFISGKVWEQLRTASRVRDRIMHPHFHENVTITDDELQAIFDANDWLTHVIGRVRLATNNAVYEE